MHEVAKRLIPQIVPWITTGVVAKGKIVHAGCDADAGARAPQGGKEVELLAVSAQSPRWGVSFWGTLICGVVDESKMPLQALAGSRAIFGARPRPGWWCRSRRLCHRPPRSLAHEGVKKLASSPKGRGAWHVAEAIRETVGASAARPKASWHPEDGQIWVQQAQGTSVANAGDGKGRGLSSRSISTNSCGM